MEFELPEKEEETSRPPWTVVLRFLPDRHLKWTRRFQQSRTGLWRETLHLCTGQNWRCETYLSRNCRQKLCPSLNPVHYPSSKREVLPNWSLGFSTIVFAWHCQDTLSQISY